MSLVVSPSPRPLSGSLLVTDASTKLTPGQLSVTCTVATIGCIEGFGAQSDVGERGTSIDGGVLSTTCTSVVALSVMLHASAPVTSSISTAGDWLTSETTTLPVTSTSVALVCCAMNSTGP